MVVHTENYLTISEKHNISPLELLLIGLNLNGLRIDSSKDFSRVRFKLGIEYDSIPEYRYLALSVSDSSAFLLDSEKIKYQNDLIGTVHSLENDTCDDTYFRMDKKALTLNSNSRSKCNGCVFCGTYKLDPADSDRLDREDRLSRKIESMLSSNGLSDFSGLDNIGIVTGCFNDEESLVEHITFVRDTFSSYGFNGEIKYIGSQLRDKRSLERLAEQGRFGLYLTVECFENREKMMKPEKASLDLNMGRNLLEYAKNIGIETTFLYVLGLDSIESIDIEFERYLPTLTRHPVINLMQNYSSEQDAYRNENAHSLEYYVKARESIERVFEKSDLRPRIWENYRSPWPMTYAGKKIEGIKI